MKREQLCCRGISTFLSLGCKQACHFICGKMNIKKCSWLKKKKNVNSLYKVKRIHLSAHTAVTEWDKPFFYPSPWLSLHSNAEEGVGPGDGSEQVGHTSWSGLLLPFAVSRATGLCLISAQTLACTWWNLKESQSPQVKSKSLFPQPQLTQMKMQNLSDTELRLSCFSICCSYIMHCSSDSTKTF